MSVRSAEHGSSPVVVYIVGSGRSGSTLLERTLGEVPGFCNVGEVVGLFRRAAVQDYRCGCGEPFSMCPFWQQVGERAFGGWSAVNLGRQARLQLRVARQRSLPALGAGARAPAGFRAAVHEYGELHRRLYQAIAEVSGARVVVDDSKWPAPAFALSKAGIDVRVLHLVRDARGVAYSWAKSDVARPHDTGRGHTMPTHPVASTALRWSAFQAEAGWLVRRAHTATTVRYEDFIAQPVPTLDRATRQLGQPVGSLRHLSADSVTLGASHGLGGNRSRFLTGEVPLRLDEQWRSAMSTKDRRVVTALALPGLVAYGYLPRRGTEPRGS